MTFTSTGSPGRSPSTSDRWGGFTLLEVLVAFAVLAVALGVAFEIFATGLRGARSADALTRAVLAAESRLAGVGIETELIPGETEGEADSGMRWHIDIREQPPEESEEDRLETPSAAILLDITVTVRWRDVGGAQSFVLRTSRLAPGGFDS